MRKIIKFIGNEFASKLLCEVNHIKDESVKERFMRIFAENEMSTFIKKEFPLIKFHGLYFTATPVLKNGRRTDGVRFDFSDKFKELLEDLYPEHTI